MSSDRHIDVFSVPKYTCLMKKKWDIGSVNRGKPLPQEVKDKISDKKKLQYKQGVLKIPDNSGKPAWNRGEAWSEEVKQKISDTKKRKFKQGLLRPRNVGKKRTEEEKEKMRQAALKMWERRKAGIFITKLRQTTKDNFSIYFKDQTLDAVKMELIKIGYEESQPSGLGAGPSEIREIIVAWFNLHPVLSVISLGVLANRIDKLLDIFFNWYKKKPVKDNNINVINITINPNFYTKESYDLKFKIDNKYSHKIVINKINKAIEINKKYIKTNKLQ